MPWQFWVDRGGTFTDVIGRTPDGQLICRKYLSHRPDRYRDAAAFGIRDILGLRPDEALDDNLVETVRVGTTVATNALLERKGEQTVLVVTRGFSDALFIGTQHRPRLFDLKIQRPLPLYSAVIEVDERVSASGEILTVLDTSAAEQALQTAYRTGCRSAAIVLMHGYRFPEHERRLAEIARRVGFAHVSASHDVNPMIKFVPRGDTTVCDAVLSPVLDRYIAALGAAVDGAPLQFMQSNGGLADPNGFRGKDAVLSGPAGGVVGAIETSRAVGFEKIIGFDMGGTSTDVSHYAGAYERTFDTVIDGVRVRAPMMKIHTVAAGGGSICDFDGLRLSVGPQSAGADPGPACYRHGGPLTITDCNVLLGRIRPDRFPHVFGSNHDQPIDTTIVRMKFEDLSARVSAASGDHWSPERLANGFIAIAVDNVARAIRKVSVEAGHDVRGYALACFGGAGGQIACRVADALGIRSIVLSPLAGVLSAYGIGLARPTVIKERTIGLPLNEPFLPQLDGALTELERAATAGLRGRTTVMRRVHVRAPGTDTPLVVPFGELRTMRSAFLDSHRNRYGFDPAPGALICETIEVEANVEKSGTSGLIADEPDSDLSATTVMAWFDGAARAAQYLDRRHIAAEKTVEGPAIVCDPLSTTVIEPGWTARRRATGELILARTGAVAGTLTSTALDPVSLELFNNLFMSIAEQMGAILQNTARSVNIRERLDFSCAVFDAEGQLIANAPHMPVHLGSMGDSVRAVRQARLSDLRVGSVFAVNNAYAGGTHLPDITVVTPVFLAGDTTPRFFVASRGHHADIGGITPGSMPPASRTIAEEGVMFDSLQIVRNDAFCDEEVRNALAAGPYPARDPETNVADLKAQCAANAAGAAELRAACERYGSDVVVAYMAHVLDHAEEAVRRAITRLSSGAYRCPMDNGSLIHVAVSIDRTRRSAVVDFAGTSPQAADNFNAPKSICRAAVLYVFRTLVDEGIPLNDGCMRPITLLIPPGSILDPQPPAAVVAGNVETSQIICDALFAALGASAAAQGTMNNFTFGNAEMQYYETICGGAGATAEHSGADAIQTHMTNSRLTDPEILESRFPVVVESFSIRRGSGGVGRRRGGDGVRRVIGFRAEMTAAILSGRRATAPFGVMGGGNALPGSTRIEFSTGGVRTLGATDQVDVVPGDRIIIETPGGGGYGSA